uniref:MARVEL domain-containing protein n=1 Tax=Parascaris univalens TaxID=6257 RepID=A0A915C1W0_PARUN
MAAPPLRWNTAFIYEKANALSLLQVFLGLASLLTSIFCFPSVVYHECKVAIHSFSQMLIIVCANSFFLVCSIILTICHLCNASDAYYRFNFPIMQKLYSSLAALIYGIAVVVVFVEIISIQFVAQWLLEIICLTATFVAYSYEGYLRWSSEYA